MKPAVKTPVESALIAAAVAILCLWMLVSSTVDGEPAASKILLLSLGLGVGSVAHLVYLAIALGKDGRRVGLWVAALVLLFPVASVVALVLLSQGGEGKPGSESAQAGS